MENQVVVGIDCASEKHQYQINEGKTVISKGQIRNTKEDAEKLVKKIKLTGKQTIIGMEATNTYHLCLQHFLQNNGLKVIVINPLKRTLHN